MLGAIIGDFLVQTWDLTGALPGEDGFPSGVHLTALTLRVLGAAQGLLECDADLADAADQCAYWMDEIENEYVHDGYELEDGSEPAARLAMEASPAGLAATIPEDAEQLAACILEGHPEIAPDAAVLAGAVCLACTGADRESIANYVLERDLEPGSPVLAGTGALLKADDFEGAVEQALTNGLGSAAAIAAACLAEPMYGIPDELADSAWDLLTPDLRTVADEFLEFVVARHADT